MLDAIHFIYKIYFIILNKIILNLPEYYDFCVSKKKVFGYIVW